MARQDLNLVDKFVELEEQIVDILREVDMDIDFSADKKMVLSQLKTNIMKVKKLDELFAELKKYNTDDVYVIGGAMFYKTMLPYCHEYLITKVDADGGAEVFYENLDAMDDKECIYVSEPVESNGYTIRFTTYKNNNPKEI